MSHTTPAGRKKNIQWKFKYGRVYLTQRRVIKPQGRIILFNKELSEEETRNYCRSLINNL